MATRSRGIKILRDLFFPPKCAACNVLLPWKMESDDTDALCSACRKVWESEKLETCGVCTKRVSECHCMPLTLQKAKCAALAKLVYYDPCKSASVQSRILYRIKKQRNDRTERFLAEELWEALDRLIEEEGVDRTSLVITYLPRAYAARAELGTDQAEVLAKRLSEIGKIPMQRLISRRLLQNARQKNLSYAGRIQNANRAFLAAKDADCKDRVVLLVDDMVTTGAGMARGTRLLKKAGARAVYGVAVASDIVNKDQIR